jgi:3-oxoadipate enol-lactonase
MSEVVIEDATIHVEVDGSGAPVTVFAHGLTNSCNELAALTPLGPGTAVRFCFRGHGHSSAPAEGYGFADFARDLDAVAKAYAATRAVGTSLGAGAITNLLGRDPARFERIVLLLPAALDRPLADHSGFDHVADLLETLPKQEAIERIVAEQDQDGPGERAPWLREIDLVLWQDLNPPGVARAIRGAVRDVAISDRELLRRVETPALIICREGDSVHPAELGRVLAELLPNAELIVLGSEREMFEAIPELVVRVSGFLLGDA